MNNILLKISNLTIKDKISNSKKLILDNVSIDIPYNKIIGIIGPSGSGKTILSKSILSLNNDCLKSDGGNIIFNNQKTNDLSEKELSKIRGKEISIVFQDAYSSLNPSIKIGKQLEEMLVIHTNVSKRKEKIINILKEFDFDNPLKIYNSYPYQLSGGQCQKIIIAMSTILHPKLLIADEPTTSLDVINEKQILQILYNIHKTYETSVLFITHNIAIASQLCDYIYILEDGKIIQSFDPKDITTISKNEKTKKYIDTSKKIYNNNIFIENISNNKCILSFDNVTVSYKSNQNNNIPAISNISFSLYENDTLGIIGETGCGKTTLARTILNLLNIDNGKISYDKSLTSHKYDIQLVSQKSYSSLDPKMSIENIIKEPLKTYKTYNKESQYNSRVMELLENVKLDKKYVTYYTNQLSGGELQRVNIARAIALNPKLLILDEPVSSLDIFVELNILDLLKELKNKYNLTYIFISHDLSIIKNISNHIIVMQKGEICEIGNTKDVFTNPKHPYTKSLLNSIPSFENNIFRKSRVKN